MLGGQKQAFKRHGCGEEASGEPVTSLPVPAAVARGCRALPVDALDRAVSFLRPSSQCRAKLSQTLLLDVWNHIVVCIQSAAAPLFNARMSWGVTD